MQGWARFLEAEPGMEHPLNPILLEEVISPLAKSLASSWSFVEMDKEMKQSVSSHVWSWKPEGAWTPQSPGLASRTIQATSTKEQHFFWLIHLGTVPEEVALWLWHVASFGSLTVLQNQLESLAMFHWWHLWHVTLFVRKPDWSGTLWWTFRINRNYNAHDTQLSDWFLFHTLLKCAKWICKVPRCAKRCAKSPIQMELWGYILRETAALHPKVSLFWLMTMTYDVHKLQFKKLNGSLLQWDMMDASVRLAIPDVMWMARH